MKHRQLLMGCMFLLFAGCGDNSADAGFTACTFGDDGGFTNSFATFESVVSECAVSARAFTVSDVVGKTWVSSSERLVFEANGTAVLDSVEQFTWSIEGGYLVMWNAGGTYYDIYAIVDEQDNRLSVKVYNEDGDLVRDTGSDGDIWSAIITIEQSQ